MPHQSEREDREAVKTISIKCLPQCFRERWKIQKQRTATNDYINSVILHDLPPDQTGLRKFRKLFTGK